MTAGPLDAALWPVERLGESIHALARAAGLPTTCRETLVPPSHIDSEGYQAWIEAAADRGGIEARSVVASLQDIRDLLRHGAPLILRLPSDGGDRFLAVAGHRKQSVTVLGPDLRQHQIPVSEICALVQLPFEAPVVADLDRLLDRMNVRPRHRVAVRARLIAERLIGVRLRTCWLLRLPVGSDVRREIRETRFASGLVWLLGLHLAQYGLFVVSWWLLGRGLLSGAIDRGWLFGWVLLVMSLVPLRVVASRLQGVLSTTAGAAIRRRLLRGALRIDREAIRAKGAGELFGVVAEAAAIEALALNGGITSSFAIAELAIAAIVIWAAAGVLPAALLIVCAGVAFVFAHQYVRDRKAWTGERLLMTHRLLESMLGHRTRLAQQPLEEWHPQEDAALARYIDSGQQMDGSTLRLAFVPRAWLTLGIVGLIPAVMAHVPPAQLAASVGGVLLAYRSLRRLSTGLSSMAGAAIAGEAIQPLAAAASIPRTAPDPAMVLPAAPGTSTGTHAVQTRQLTFRYPGQTTAVLDNCTLNIAKGARVLLEGPSGAGKTTLASVLAGLERPDSGLLLVDGLDRSVLGHSGWRRRIVMAPQAHDNYLITASLAFNLLLGRRWPAQRSDLQEAETVCRELGLGDLLDRLPGGLHQIIGETGWQLSQGERTRVFLARALLQKPAVLVLDESFSALDPENMERAIRCVQRRASTVLAVAHV